ncbi:hypothetical protein SUGI_1075470 [Cryptomeria japonica]|nr:hypothetical protein SUGI_1075470 [Cryptomeria japonica]
MELRVQGDGCMLVLRMESQDNNTLEGDGMTSIEPSAGNINDVCVIRNSGLMLMVLEAYIHGYFIDSRLYLKEKSMADPFAYEAYRKIKKRIQEKIEAERTNRIMV